MLGPSVALHLRGVRSRVRDEPAVLFEEEHGLQQQMALRALKNVTRGGKFNMMVPPVLVSLNSTYDSILRTKKETTIWTTWHEEEMSNCIVR